MYPAKFLVKSVCLLLMVLSHHIASAQKKGRPKIGLTLSGGGAKGLAHIGILQAIDSAQLKISYVTGTSMGSVVGGLYAAGYSGDEIERLARALDWNVLFSTSPQLSEISIEEKSEYEKYPLLVPLVKGKVKIGKGIISGQELWLKFAELFEPVYNIHDFSKLPIPFKCIGTDLSTGNAVELDHGNIIDAIRASMAIPSVFTPVKIDGKLLADGGMVNNLPALNVKKMGADYIIGVKVAHGLKNAEELATAVDILGQIAFFVDAAGTEKHQAACDMLISPPLEGYSAGSFSDSDTIIEIGKRTGRMLYPYFKRLADSLNAIYGKEEFKKDRTPLNREIIVSKYSVTGLKQTQEKFFYGMLGLKNEKTYSYKEVNEAVHRVYGSRYYKIIQFDFLPDTNGKNEMRFKVEENPLTHIKLGINYNSFTQIGILMNLTSRDLLFNESRALVSLSVSENPQLYAEYFKFINRKRTARLFLDYCYQLTDFPVYKDFRLYQTNRSTYSIYDVQIQNNLTNSSYIGIGQQFYNSRIRTEENPSLIYNGQNSFMYTYLGYVLNTANSKYYPTRGADIRIKAGYAYSQNPSYDYSYDGNTVSSDSVPVNKQNYFKVSFTATKFTKLHSKLTLIENLSFAYISQNNIFVGDKFVVGGINDIIVNQFSFAGLSVSELKTNSIAAVRLGLQWQIAKKAYIIARTNVGIYDFQSAKPEHLTLKNNFLSGYGLTFAYYSPIGPLEITGMYCDQDAMFRSFVNLGFTF